MKAKLWKMKICNGLLEMTHGWSQEVLEIEIPEYNISINFIDGKAHYFQTYKNRYEKAIFVSNIDFSEEIAKGLDQIIGLQESFNEDVGKLFSEITTSVLFTSQKPTKLKKA